MAVVHCWVLLGEQGTRKGSVIRSLTGLPREGHCDVVLDNGHYLRLWTAVMSANEAADAMLPAQWVADCDRAPGPPDHAAPVASRINILTALRLNHGAPNRRPEDYLDALATANAVIHSIITLGQVTPAWVPPYGVPYAHIPYPNVPRVDVPTNEIAARVRQLWGWR